MVFRMAWSPDVGPEPPNRVAHVRLTCRGGGEKVVFIIFTYVYARFRLRKRALLSSLSLVRSPTPVPRRACLSVESPRGTESFGRKMETRTCLVLTSPRTHSQDRRFTYRAATRKSDLPPPSPSTVAIGRHHHRATTTGTKGCCEVLSCISHGYHLVL